MINAAETTIETAEAGNERHSFFNTIRSFADARQMAKSLAESSLVPEYFRKRHHDCIVVVEAAAQLGISPLQVMQNIDIMQDQPVWRTPFLVVCINTCGRFSYLRYENCGEPGTPSYGKFARAETPAGGILTGPVVTLALAESCGWNQANPKWQEMPELMLANFAAIQFARIHAPDIFMGIKAEDEIVRHPVDNELSAAELKRLDTYLQRQEIPVTAMQVRNFLKEHGEIFNFDLIKANLDYIVNAITRETAND